MHVTDPPVPGVAPVLDRAETRRFAETLRAIDPCAPPSGPLAGGLHLAVAALADAEMGGPAAAARADLLAGLCGALAALDEAPLGEATPHELMELIVRVDDAKALLEMPDLSVIPTGELAAWFRQLYSAIMRLRVAALRLHRAWLDTARRPEGGLREAS
jgi:hypothetical protein